MYTTYILKSAKTGRYYVGYSGNLEQRLEKHNAGYSRATRSGIPWELVWSIDCESKTRAIKLERWIKGMKSKAFIEKIIREEVDLKDVIR